MEAPTPRKTAGGALARHHRLLVLVVLACTGAAALAAMLRPPTYEATAVLGLDESQAVSGGFDLAVQADQFLSQRYIRMATSRPLLEQVCAAAATSCTAASLAQRVSATTSKTGGAIQVTVTAGSGRPAAALANAVAGQVLEEHRAEIAAGAGPARGYLPSAVPRLRDPAARTRAPPPALPLPAPAPA